MKQTKAKTAILSGLIALMACSAAHAGGRVHPERWYQEQWCAAQGGAAEVVLADRTRCDCVTADYAVEADFADKWAEAIGQALHYAAMTGKKPGVLLIVEHDREFRYLQILKGTLEHWGLEVRVWVIRP